MVLLMVFNTAVLYSLRFGGTLFSGEQWECGVHMGAATNSGTASQYEAAITGFIQDANMAFNNQAKLTYIKRNAIDQVTYKYLDQGSSDTFSLTTPVAGTASAAPGQQAMAITLTTAQLRGLGHEGRFYIPLGTLNINPTGRVGDSQAGVMSIGAGGFISNLNAVRSDNRVCVWSAKAHVMREVTGVRVGDVVDTQRRRRKQLVEKYFPTPVA